MCFQVQIQEDIKKKVFCLKSYLPGERLTPSCHHKQRGGNDQAVLFSLISRVEEPGIRYAFKAGRSVCVAQETEPEADGSQNSVLVHEHRRNEEHRLLGRM